MASYTPHQRSVHRRVAFHLSFESVEVKHIAGGDLSDIYGQIFIANSWCEDYAYKREPSNPERKHVGDFLTLTGPTVKLIAGMGVDIHVDLHDGRGQFAKGQISFNLGLHGLSRKDTDKRLSHDISGDWGTITLNFSVLNCSINADVEIAVMGSNGEPEEGLEMYGTIRATQMVRINGSRMTLTLLENPDVDDRVATLVGGVVPLSRSIVVSPTAVLENAVEKGMPVGEACRAAPPDFWDPDLPQLVISVDLWAKMRGSETVEIARGEAQFNVKLTDHMFVPKSQIITGSSGRRVIVSIACK